MPRTLLPVDAEALHLHHQAVAGDAEHASGLGEVAAAAVEGLADEVCLQVGEPALEIQIIERGSR